MPNIFQQVLYNLQLAKINIHILRRSVKMILHKSYLSIVHDHSLSFQPWVFIEKSRLAFGKIKLCFALFNSGTAGMYSTALLHHYTCIVQQIRGSVVGGLLLQMYVRCCKKIIYTTSTPHTFSFFPVSLLFYQFGFTGTEYIRLAIKLNQQIKIIN